MSRTFFLQEEMARSDAGGEAAKSVASLADAISGLDKEVLNEVILEVATKEEKKSNPDIRKIKLEVVTQQNERIREEREAAEKKKKSTEKPEVQALEPPVAPVHLERSPEQVDKLAQTIRVQSSGSQSDVLVTAETSAVPGQGKAVIAETTVTVDEEKEHELSPAEMDAISQLLSADPVSKEREDLARIKSAMAEKVEVEEPVKEAEPRSVNDIAVTDVDEKASMVNSMPKDDEQAAATIEKMEMSAAAEADKSTIFSQGTQLQPSLENTGSERVEEDPVVARLKKRIETMVDKIELQLSDVEGKIGDKLHFLDKDADGVLTREEMAECLQFALKREITFDEAMEIAGTIVSDTYCGS